MANVLSGRVGNTPITAYGAAKARGYTGTLAEFEALMASYATVAQEAAASASTASTAATTATTAATAAAASAASLTIDTEPTEGSTNAISSGAVYDLKEDLDLKNTLLTKGTITASEFIQGGRPTDVFVVQEDESRCTIAQPMPISAGDVVAFSAITDGYKYAFFTSYGYNLKWKTANYTYTATADGYIGVTVAASDGTSAITPEDFALTVTVTDKSSVGALAYSGVQALNISLSGVQDYTDFLTWEVGGIDSSHGTDAEYDYIIRTPASGKIWIGQDSYFECENIATLKIYAYKYDSGGNFVVRIGEEKRKILPLDGGYYYRFAMISISTSDVITSDTIANYYANTIVCSRKMHAKYHEGTTYPAVYQGGLYSSDGSNFNNSFAIRTMFYPIDVCTYVTLKANLVFSVFYYNASFDYIGNTSTWQFGVDKIDVKALAEANNIDISSAEYFRIVFKNSDNRNYTPAEAYGALAFCGDLWDSIYTDFHTPVYSGKKLSIFGDSISTYTDWIPSGNATYYTGSNAGVNNVADTWWAKVINALGFDLLINNSWSGRAVSNVRDSEASHSTDAGYKEANVLALKTEDYDPDVIIIKLGINDFNNGCSLGTYDGSSALPTDPTLFLDAYAMMLDLIMTNFPLAEVWCCTLMQCERSGSVGFPEINSRGETLSKWNEGIAKLAHAFGAKILHHDQCGITYYNLSTYTGDYTSSGSGLHPNNAGHSLIANATIREMDSGVRTMY